MSNKQSLSRKAAPVPAELADQRVIAIGNQLAALGQARLGVLRNPHLTDSAERAMLRDLQRQRDALRAKHPEFGDMFEGDDWDWDYLDAPSEEAPAPDAPPEQPHRRKAANIFELHDLVAALLHAHLDTPNGPSEDIGHWAGKGLAIRVRYAEGSFATIMLSDDE